MRIKRPPGESIRPADETMQLREYLKPPTKCSFGLPGCLGETSSDGSVSDYYEDDLIQRFREATIRGGPARIRRIRTPSPPPAPIALPPYFRFVNDKREFAKKAWLWPSSGPDYDLVIQPKKWYAGGIRELYIYFFDIEFPDGLSSTVFPLREIVVEHWDDEKIRKNQAPWDNRTYMVNYASVGIPQSILDDLYDKLAQ